MKEQPTADQKVPLPIAWRSPKDRTPSSPRPVLIAFKHGDTWIYYIAKFTGKRWLETNPEETNAQYAIPDCWKDIEAPI